MKTFLILSKPPDGKTLTAEAKASSLKETLLSSVILLKRSDNDPANIGKRVHAITAKPVSDTFRDFTCKGVKDFATLAEAGDRVVVLTSENNWEQHLVV